MFSSVSGHHFPGQWPVTQPYKLDPALVYLNIPASVGTSQFLNRGSAIPLQTSALNGVNVTNGPPAYGVNPYGYVSGGGNFDPPSYPVSQTNLQQLFPSTTSYVTFSYWVNIPTISVSNSICYLPSLYQTSTSPYYGSLFSILPNSTGSSSGHFRIQQRTPGVFFNLDGNLSTFQFNVWKHVVATFTYGGGPCYIYLNGVQLMTWNSNANSIDPGTGSINLDVTFGAGHQSNVIPAKWNDFRAENRQYTLAMALAAFQSRRAYYGV